MKRCLLSSFLSVREGSVEQPETCFADTHTHDGLSVRVVGALEHLAILIKAVKVPPGPHPKALLGTPGCAMSGGFRWR